VRALLALGEPVLLVATSLIEAGVDLDFPVLWRAWTRAESLQQAAGRCNREGRLNPPGGRVVVFDPVGGGLPSPSKIFKMAAGQTRAHFGPGLRDPDDIDALAAYYQTYLSLLGENSLGREVQRERIALDFPAVAELFQMIEQGRTRPVVCLRYEEQAGATAADARKHAASRRAAEATVARLRGGESIGRDELRALQPWTASLSAYVADKALAAGKAVPLIGDLMLWQGTYDQQRGIVPDALEDPRELMC
jgi:CRISPR-associated endonuclease/helicase Cas3